MKLVLPTIEYKKSYLEAYKEFEADGFENAANYRDVSYQSLVDDFETYVQKLHDQIEGKNLPEGYVSATEFWIIENQEYLGRVHIRHKLTDYLEKFGGHIGYNIRPSARRKGYGSKALELGLREAKALGLEKVLLTCNEDNHGSIKIIENNGGVLENTIVVKKGQPRKLRYWISVEA